MTTLFTLAPETRIPVGLPVALPLAAPNTSQLASDGGLQGRTWDGTRPPYRGRSRIPAIPGGRP